MNRSGDILIIEDDLDDQFIMGKAFNELNYSNKVVFFDDSMKALKYLTESNTKPFLILSDINMPSLDGIQLRHTIYTNETFRVKYIPYIIFTTSNHPQHVLDAYLMSVQGYFTKPSSYDDLVKTINMIVQYWQVCELPNLDVLE